jgi:hypothetical protein
MSETDVRDRWLFLTPEAEAELPPAVAALAAALEERGRGELEETEVVEGIVTGGGYGDWLAYMRGRRILLERYLEQVGADALAGHVAEVLNNHWLLALTVPGREHEAAEERSRVAELLRKVKGPSAR